MFCRGLGRFELDAPVVFAQTQSLHARKHLLTEPFDDNRPANILDQYLDAAIASLRYLKRVRNEEDFEAAAKPAVTMDNAG